MSYYRIDELFSFEKGTLQSSKCEPGKYSFITASSEWKTHKDFTHDCEALVFAAAASGSLGRTHYINGKFIASDLCFILTPKDAVKFPIDLKFYHIIFNTLKADIVKNTKAGTSKEAIGLGAFGKYELPYFEMEKQIEIKSQFVGVEAVKENIYSEFSKQKALVKQLRQALLREGLQGKLVPQEAKDGNAVDLLVKIKAQKEKLIKAKEIKIGKLQDAEILDDLLFDIPKSWSWCKLDEICFNITDGTHQTPTYTKSGRVFLSAQNVKPFRFMPEEHKYVSEEAYSEIIRNRKPLKGDVLVARVGAGIGEAAVIDREIDFCFYVSLALVQPFKDYINSDYLAFVFNSPYGVQYAKGNISSKGGSAGNFNLGRIRSMLIPLPPLKEQHRIVRKLEQIVQLCDSLQQNIEKSELENEWLLQQVLKEALQLKEQEIEA